MFKYPYNLKRTARKSICVRIGNDNSLFVSCPGRTSVAEIEKFLNSKLEWIEKHFDKNNHRNDFLSAVIAYEQVLVKGVSVEFSVGDANEFSASRVQVKNLKALKRLFVNNLGDEFMQVYNDVCKLSGLKGSKVGFRDYKSRWGCCDKLGSIVFNYKLLMLSERIWRYVIMHELCHTVYMNHSRDFYRLLQTFMPDYKTVRAELKSYTVIASLY